jgi:hypothetical protein
LDLDKARVYGVLEQHSFLEPREKASEDVIISLNPDSIYKVGAYWIESRVAWSSIHVIVPSRIRNSQSVSARLEEEE